MYYKKENEDSSSDDDVIVPQHKFDVKVSTYASGKRKGQEKTLVTLQIEPNTFTRKKVQKNVTTFECNECKKEGYNTYAKAVINGSDENGKPNYKLTQWP